MTSEVAPGEERPADGFAARMAFALHKDPADDIRRTNVTLRIVLVLLIWLVTVPILVVYGLTGAEPGNNAIGMAAFGVMLGPFVAAVIATRNERPGLGTVFVVLTLLMVLPAAAIAQAG